MEDNAARTTTEMREDDKRGAYKCGIMGVEDKVIGGYGWRTIAVVGMRDNGDSGDRDTGIWIQPRKRHGTGDRSNTGRWK